MLRYWLFSVVSFFMTGYLPVGFELAAEITYPEAEGTTSGLLNASAQIFGLAVTWIASAMLDQIGTSLTNSILCGLLVVGSILTFFIPNDLRRRAAHASANYCEA
jgi:FLVCR family feline leukemia virus subgroup C receptor-related protein